MKLSQKQIIIKVLEENYPNFVMSYDLEKVSTKWGYIGTAGLKRCRELRAEGKIEQRDKGLYVEYRLLKEGFDEILHAHEIKGEFYKAKFKEDTQPKFDPHFAVTSFKQASML